MPVDIRGAMHCRSHSDQIGGAKGLGGNAVIIAHDETARLPRRAADPNRPLPTVTFSDRHTLRVGGQVLVPARPQLWSTARARPSPPLLRRSSALCTVVSEDASRSVPHRPWLAPLQRDPPRQPRDLFDVAGALAAIEPGARPDLLRSFQMPAPGEPVRNTVQMGDPGLQPFLDEVWLPFWESQPARLRRHYPDDHRWPGLELARRRAGIARLTDESPPL